MARCRISLEKFSCWQSLHESNVPLEAIGRLFDVHPTTVSYYLSGQVKGVLPLSIDDGVYEEMTKVFLEARAHGRKAVAQSLRTAADRLDKQ